VRLAVWAAVIIAAAIIGNQLILFRSDWPQATLLAIVVAGFLGVPLVFGALAGALIRRGGPWRELFVLAGIGAACFSFALAGQWVSDPRTCTPDPGTDCDTGYAVGAIYMFILSYVPFLVAAAGGRLVSVLASHRGANPSNVGKTI
jgi:hypothetical protein